MLSPKRTLQVLIPSTPKIGSPIKSQLIENENIDNKIKLVLLGLEIERLHKVAILITDKYEDKIQQLEATQQLLKDKIDNQEVKIATLNQQLLIKDDFINEIFDEKCLDEVNKKLNNQLKQVTQQLNRAKKQIETLNEMNIIFKKNPPDNPELIDMIKQLEDNYEEMLQKKDQEITNLKIRNSSYDQSHSQEITDQKQELLRIQLENQFLNDKIDTILEQNEKLKQQLKPSHSQQSSINGQPQYRLVTKVIQQEPFSAFSDFQFLGKNNRVDSQYNSDSPQRTSNQNSQEFMQTLKKIEKIQLDGQFTPEKVLSQIRLSATLLHLKRMELPNDLNDTYVKYLNQIEESDVKSDHKSDLASTVKPKKLFSKNDDYDTQQKQVRSQSTKSNNQKPFCSNKTNQFVQVDFLDKKQLEKTQIELDNLQNEFQQLQKLINSKPVNDKYLTQSDIKNSLESDEVFKQFQKDNTSKLKDNLNRQSDYSLKDLQAQSNLDKQTIQQLKRQVENLEEQLQYLKVQNQRQTYLIKQLQDKNQKEKEKLDDYQILIKEENGNLNSTIQKLQKELNNLKQRQNKTSINKLIQTDNLYIQITKQTQTIELQYQLENDELINLHSQQDKLKINQQNQDNIQNLLIQEKDQKISNLQQENQDLLQNANLQQEQLKQTILQLVQENNGTIEIIEDLKQKNDKLQQELDFYKCEILNHHSDKREDDQIQIKIEKVDKEIQLNLYDFRIKDDMLEERNVLQNLLEQSTMELKQKQIDLDQLQCYCENLMKQNNQLKQNNEDLQQIIKEQESEYQTQLSLIKLRLSALEEQQVKEHSRSISISENNDQIKETNKQSEDNIDFEITIRRLLDEKAVLYDQMQKQQQDFKQQIKILNEEIIFQKLQFNELENKIVLYEDKTQQLMQENQNLGNQVQNLSNQLILARQQNKIQSQKQLQSTTQSPRVQIENQQQIQIIKDQENEIIQLRSNSEQIQLEQNNLNQLFNEKQNENQELQHEILTLKTENSFEKQENQRLKQQIISTKDQLLMLNKQLDLNKKNNKKEIDFLNSQIEQYKIQLFSTQSKLCRTQDQSTQLDSQVYVIDQDLLDEKEKIIHNLKKSIQYKDQEFDKTLQNLLITRQELFKTNDQLQKLRNIQNNQVLLQSQSNQSRKYNDCTLYPPRQNKIIQIQGNSRISVSEERHKNHSLDKLESVAFWKKKYEEVLQQNYMNQQFNQQNQQYKIKYEELQINCQNHLKELDNYKEQNKQLLQMIDAKLMNNNSQFIYEQEIQNLRKQLEKLNSELREQTILSNKYQKELQQIQLQNKNETNQQEIENYVNQIFNVKQENLQLLEINQDYQNSIKDFKQKLKELDDQLIKSISYQDELKFTNNQLIQDNQQLLLAKSDQEKQILLLTKSEQQQCYKFNYHLNFERSKEFNFNRSEIMHNLDVIRQELKVYQSKCQIQEFEINQLKLQLQQPIPQQKLISPNKFKEQYEYLNQILKELEITKLQNENLRKQNSELFDYQSKLIYENDNLKRLNINSPLSSPRISYQIQNSQQKQNKINQNADLNQQIDSLYQKINTAKISDMEELKHELDILKRQVLKSSTQVKEAETLSLQARVLTLENQLQSSQNQIENLKEIIQENQELKQQIRQLKESNSKIQLMFNNNQKIQQPDLSQTERLNRELTEKISELTQLKIKYKQALTIMQKMENRQIQ